MGYYTEYNNYNDSSACVWLIGGLFAIGIILYAFIYLVIPASLITIGGIAIAGAGSGTYVASKNFGEVLVEAHKNVK